MATVKNLTLEMLPKFFCGLLYMLGVCHLIFGKFFNVKVFTVTVNVTVTLVQAIFQKNEKFERKRFNKIQMKKKTD